MPLKFRREKSYRVELYIPSSAEGLHTLQHDMATAFGGCTSQTAYGHWQSPRGIVVGEPCMIVQSVVHGYSKTELRGWVVLQGMEFMRMNPHEEMFLGYVAGEKIIIERE